MLMILYNILPNLVLLLFLLIAIANYFKVQFKVALLFVISGVVFAIFCHLVWLGIF